VQNTAQGASGSHLTNFGGWGSAQRASGLLLSSIKLPLTYSYSIGTIELSVRDILFTTIYQGVLKMTVKKTTHKDNKAIALTASEQRAISIAELIKTGDTIGKDMDNLCKAEHKYRKGKPVGTVRSGDAFMVRLNESLIGLGYTGSTLANKLTAVRIAVNEGKNFAHKPYAQPTKKGASTAPKGKAVSGVKFKGDAKIEDIVKGLREMFNKFKADDKTAELASFLIDALDEFDGE